MIMVKNDNKNLKDKTNRLRKHHLQQLLLHSCRQRLHLQWLLKRPKWRRIRRNNGINAGWKGSRRICTSSCSSVNVVTQTASLAVHSEEEVQQAESLRWQRFCRKWTTWSSRPGRKSVKRKHSWQEATAWRIPQLENASDVSDADKRSGKAMQERRKERYIHSSGV